MYRRPGLIGALLKTSRSILPLALLLLWPAAGFAKKGESKAPKPNGSHFLMVTGPEEYWKTLGNMAVTTAQRLVKDGAVITLPFIEPVKEPPLDVFNAAYKKKYRKGVKRYKKGKYKAAIPLLSDAIAQFTTMGETYGWTYNIRRNLALSYMYLGAAQLLEAMIDEARTSFRLANSVYPGYPLPKAAFSNKSTLEAYNKAIEIPGGGTGELIVNSSVQGFVFVDGHIVGVTPTTVSGLNPGTHGVVFARIGYKPVFLSIKLSEGGRGVADFSKVVKSREDLFKKYILPLDKDLRAAGKEVPARVKELSKRLRVKNTIIIRSSANDTELSWYEDTNGSWQKRVRRENAVPGNMETELWKKLMVPKPIMDIGSISSNVNRCFSDRDCPGGECLGGRCISTTPIYKTWWFWTAVGVGVSALGGGTYLLFKLKNRPSFEFSTP